MMKESERIFIGTSGWHYEHWKGPFYPNDLPASRFLEFYRERFRTVEINNSFYRMPEKKTLAAWRDAVPGSFIFAVKASRYITHMKKLKGTKRPLAKFLDAVNVLGNKLGPVLFQLPPRWKMNAGRLEEFLALLPQGRRFAFEFRDPSWFSGEVYRLLGKAGAAFCIYHLAGLLSPKEVTADFVYVRLHGPAGAYRGQYSTETLAGWAKECSKWAEGGKEVYCYFDNDEAGYAARDAERLQKMIRQ